MGNLENKLDSQNKSEIQQQLKKTLTNEFWVPKIWANPIFPEFEEFIKKWMNRQRSIEDRIARKEWSRITEIKEPNDNYSDNLRHKL